MDTGILTTLTDFINGVGFPIAVCIALFWNNRETTKHYHGIITEFQENIKKNTEALERLTIKVDRNDK